MNISLANKNEIVLSNPPAPAEDAEVSYPGTWLRFDLDNDPSFPMEGEITFRYAARRKSVETKAESKGKWCVEYSLDLKAVTGLSEETRPQKTKSAEEALDQLYEAKED